MEVNGFKDVNIWATRKGETKVTMHSRGTTRQHQRGVGVGGG